MRRFLFLLICIAALLVAASPVAAAGPPATGTRISLFAPPATYPAGDAFYIEHGFVCEAAAGDRASDCMAAKTHFDLYIDGVLQSSTLVVDNSPQLWVKLNLSNHADGLAAGVHSFEGVWFEGGAVILDLSAEITFE